MSNYFGGMSLYELGSQAEQVKETIQQGLSNADMVFRNASTDELGIAPMLYWEDLAKSFQDLSEEEKNKIFKELFESHAKTIAFLQNLVLQVAKLSAIVEILTDVASTHDQEAMERHTETHKLWRLMDAHEHEFVNLRSKTRSFAIIGGGKNNESNIPGRDKPDSDTGGEGSKSITEDSS